MSTHHSSLQQKYNYLLCAVIGTCEVQTLLKDTKIAVLRKQEKARSERKAHDANNSSRSWGRNAARPSHWLHLLSVSKQGQRKKTRPYLSGKNVKLRKIFSIWFNLVLSRGVSCSTLKLLMIGIIHTCSEVEHVEVWREVVSDVPSGQVIKVRLVEEHPPIPDKKPKKKKKNLFNISLEDK